ncbi:peptidoglycan hydrolase-like protein with peptidoglycan-binding domain [Kribbella voronezhensis]|uniref:Peptidoglycan hydrolase-like protein with peptidoglycan-binding domain n=1 Tax=Kribbella voronezhensis TaxID=2512212 RepID=A0A4R7SW18_9ACTN|nr:peptidoglycan-binding protein [Kribbella voronezhensis]TDU83401.1 peptidoglycan hydrolase-like protein with peptidoglycan-binding domain [Kribbella voronezhensis]
MADRPRRVQDARATKPVAGRHQPAPAPPEHELARLQRQVGNRVVADFVTSLAVQRLKEGDGPSHDVGVIQQQLNLVSGVARLAITGRFDPETTAAAKAFQRKLIAEKVAGVVEDGIVDGVTHAQLKSRAPSVTISGTDTVVVGPGNTQVPLNPALGTHKQLQAGAKGVAVKELQDRLNHSGATTGKKLVIDGIFGTKTDAALKEFQTSVKVAANGVADPGTWAKLETAGAAGQGHVEFDWREEVEGVKNVGLRAAYDWKLSKTALSISVGITFTKKQAGVDAKISQWLSDIKEIWSTFKAVNHSDPKKKSMNLDFKAVRGGGDHAVDVFRFDPALPKKQRGDSRSNSGTWYTIDPRRSMAPHEFGHLIGLADEYNRTEDHYVATTGEEPDVADPAGVAADGTKLATNIKANLPLTDVLAAPIAASDDKRWGAKLAAVVNGALGEKQGGFSRFVAQQYAKANAGASVYNDIQAAFNAKAVTGFQENFRLAVTPFLYSNKSLMGTMETTPAKGGGGLKAADHEHPIEPRHVQPYVNLLAREWTLQTGAADVWKPERR